MTFLERLEGVAERCPPHLASQLASTLPFMDLFRDAGGLLYDDDDEVYYGLDSDLPLPDEDGSMPVMHWSAGIYADHVEVLRLRRCGSVSNVVARYTLSYGEFWGLLRRYGEMRAL